MREVTRILVSNTTVNKGILNLPHAILQTKHSFSTTILNTTSSAKSIPYHFTARHMCKVPNLAHARSLTRTRVKRVKHVLVGRKKEIVKCREAEYF